MVEEKIISPSETKRYWAGIDAGSVSINCVVIDDTKSVVYEHPYQRHLGRVEKSVFNLIRSLYNKFGEKRIQAIAFTGNHGKNLSEKLDLFYEFETISQVIGSVFIRPDVRTIICMGGQDTALFQIKHHDKGWELEYFNTNGPCAAGTGSFIDQQAQRLATAMYSSKSDPSANQIDHILSGFIDLGLKSQNPSSVACRCTVFTKSDMIHLQNKGEHLEDIIFGLHVGNARNYMSTIVSNRMLKEPMMFIGGLSLNTLQVKAFEKYYPSLITPPHNTSVGALGVAFQAWEMDLRNSADIEKLLMKEKDDADSIPLGAKLEITQTPFPRSNEVQVDRISACTPVFLGIDIGSTTTKYVIIDEHRKIIHKQYIPTRGKPIEVTQNLLDTIQNELGNQIEIKGVATTGSGRNVVGDFITADLIIDEITAHARGAVEIDSEVDTIFEIGGQDSKYISISNTYPLDFDMNKVCAAGTGSFLHELANKYGINIVGEFQDIALSSDKPVKLAERCTVFMESDLVSYHQKGLAKNDLIAGLCYAIVHNYLNRVVGKRKIGRRIMFLGGPSLNKGVVAAFENVMGHGLIVPRHREVLGAYGAAISVQEKMSAGQKDKSSFRGLDNIIHDRMDFKEKVCRVDPQCHNQCKLKIYDFDGRRSIWGGECGRYEVTKSERKKKENYFELRKEIWDHHLENACAEFKGVPILEVDGRPTVGMQRSLYGLHGAILWAHFFDHLGFRLVLTPPTNHQISMLGIETMTAETCYPVKVSHGHVKELLGKTKYLFLPSFIDMPTPETSERGFYCPLVQSNAYMIRSALPVDESNLIDPIIYLKQDPETLAVQLSEQIRKKLKVTKKKINQALHYGLQKQRSFVKSVYSRGREVIETIDPEEPLIVVTGRPYNLYDDRLNLRLGQNLSKIGVKALPMDFIDTTAVSLKDFPSMYWGLGAQILRTAKRVKEIPNYFGLHLTNFGCGADSFIEHFYKYVMGNKAYLILELDEHSAVAGVMTRLEAFKNVIDNSMIKADARREEPRKAVN